MYPKGYGNLEHKFVLTFISNVSKSKIRINVYGENVIFILKIKKSTNLHPYFHLANVRIKNNKNSATCKKIKAPCGRTMVNIFRDYKSYYAR